MLPELGKMLGLRALLSRFRQRGVAARPNPLADCASSQGPASISVASLAPELVPAHSPETPSGSPPPRPVVEPIDNRPWMKLVEECVDLVDELDGQLAALDPGGREIAEHVCLRLQEVLQRCGVTLIDQPGAFERTLHQPVGPGTGAGTPQVEVLSPGFRVDRRILRRARVQFLPATPS